MRSNAELSDSPDDLLADVPMDETYIVYDGACPFCSAYVRLAKFREVVGTVILVNAREEHPLAQWLWSAGCQLDDEMALIWKRRVFLGAAALRQIALLSSRTDFFNRLQRLILSSTLTSRLLYPVLRFGRRITLALLRRGNLKPPPV